MSVSAVRALIAAGLAAGTVLVPVRADAQRDSVRVFVRRAATPFEVKLERLAIELLAQRQIAESLTARLSATQALLRTASLSDSSRTGVVSNLRVLETRLASVEVDRARLQAALATLCPQERQPDGWVGVTFTSDWDIDMTPAGLVTRFREYPGVELVEPASPAEKAGIQRGDRLVSIGGIDLSDGKFSVSGMLKPGVRLPVTFVRGVETKHVMVIVEPRPVDYEVPCAWVDEQLTSALSPVRRGRFRILLPPVVVRQGGARAEGTRAGASGDGPPTMVVPGGAVFREPPLLGMGTEWVVGAQLAALNENLAEALGASSGVLVIDVAKRSPAAQSGLRGGDVIVSVDGKRIVSPSALDGLMEGSTSRELKLQVIRLRKKEDVTLKW